MPGTGEVFGQFTAHHAGSNDGDLLRSADQLLLQSTPSCQVVDTPAERGRQIIRQGGPGTLRQYQMAIGQSATCGTQLPPRRTDANDKSLAEQAHAQTTGSIRCGFLDQRFGLQATTERH